MRRRTGPHLVLVLLMLLTGCSLLSRADAAPQPELPAGSSAHEVTVDGVARAFRTYRPAGLQEPAPLVLVFHGLDGSADLAQNTFGWDAVADQEGFVVAYPQGVGNSFNAGVCCATAMEQGVDDVAAALAIVDQVAARVPVDAARLYVAGFSNGGAMTYRLACETDRFAAFAPLGGGQLVDCADRKPTSILHIHGGADKSVPIGGDPGGGMGHPPIDETLAGWRTFEQCGTPTENYSADDIYSSSSACAGGHEVNLIVVDRLDHSWPTAADGLPGAEVQWEFFARHRR